MLIRVARSPQGLIVRPCRRHLAAPAGAPPPATTSGRSSREGGADVPRVISVAPRPAPSKPAPKVPAAAGSKDVAVRAGGGAVNRPAVVPFALRPAFHPKFSDLQVWRYNIRDPLYDRKSAVVVCRVESAAGLPDTVVHVLVTDAHVRDPHRPGEMLEESSWMFAMYARALDASVISNVGSVTPEHLETAHFEEQYGMWRRRFDSMPDSAKAGEVVDVPLEEVFFRLERRLIQAASDPELAARMARDSPGFPVGDPEQREAERERLRSEADAVAREAGASPSNISVENLKRKYKKNTAAPLPQGFPDHLKLFVPGYVPKTDEEWFSLVNTERRAGVEPKFTTIK